MAVLVPAAPPAAPPSSGGRSLTVPGAVVALVGVVTVVAIVLSSAPVGAAPAFLPGFLAAVAILDLLTAVLLAGQHLLGASARLLWLSAAYLWSATTIVAQALVFPGFFSDTGLLGAVPSSAVWLWVSWHVGFPVLVAAALGPWTRSRVPRAAQVGARRQAFAASVLAGTVLVALVPLALVTAGASRLPVVIVDGDYSVLVQRFGVAILLIVGGAVAVAATGCWRLRGGSGVEVWAVVAACAYLGDVVITLSAQERFTVGWYGARVLAATAAIVVLAALVRDTGRTYGRVARFAAATEEANTSLAEAVELRRHLAAVVSHELRTPLTVLTGLVEVLQDEPDLPPDEVDRLLARCAVMVRRLSLMTEDLLTAAASEQAALQVSLRPLHLREQLDDLAATFPQMDVHVACPAHLVVSADPLRLQQVLGNLVRNAEKYAEPPVRILAERQGARVVLVVTDGGAGVPQDVVPVLFERWTRAVDHRTRPGAGLGLPVARELCVAQGGDLSYDVDRRAFVVELATA